MDLYSIFLDRNNTLYTHINICVTVFIAIDRNSHSNTDTLYGIFPYFVSAFTLLFWIASNNSNPEIRYQNHIKN